MMLMLVLQIIFWLIPTLAWGGPTEVPDKCSTSSPNYCVCKENDTVLLKPVTLCLSPTHQNDQLIDCFPCYVSDQDLLNCTSLKDGYPVCPLQQFQSAIVINKSDMRSRSKGRTLPHNNWCRISRNKRNGTLNCTVRTHKKDCVLSCNKGYEIEGKPSLKMSCVRRNNKWEPKSIRKACKKSDKPSKERPQQLFTGEPGAPGGAPVFIPEYYDADFGDSIDDSYFDFGFGFDGEPQTYVEKFFDYPEDGFPPFRRLLDDSADPEGQMN